MRLFVAINFPQETVELLYDKVISLERQAVSLTPSRRENLHLTLAFIGETERVDEAVGALSSIDFEPFEITVSNLGTFPRDTGDIYWAGVERSGGFKRLESLAKEVCSRLDGAGFEIEKRKFSPHVTLARQVVLREKPQLEIPPHRVQVKRISLMSSRRIQGRLTYTEIYGRDAL